MEPEPRPGPPDPNELQREALAALDATRRAGRRRALVVMATGLGKTWLAAFDVAATAEGRMPDVGEGGWIERGGKRLRVVGHAEDVGLRIDGGPDGFRERAVSLVDIA